MCLVEMKGKSNLMNKQKDSLKTVTSPAPVNIRWRKQNPRHDGELNPPSHCHKEPRAPGVTGSVSLNASLFPEVSSGIFNSLHCGPPSPDQQQINNNFDFYLFVVLDLLM